MIFVVTQDYFLFRGIAFQEKRERVVQFHSLSELINSPLLPSDVNIIVDAYYTKAMDDHHIRFLQDITVKQIIILSPFRVSKLFFTSPLFFMNRKDSLLRLSLLINGIFPDKLQPSLRLSYIQLKILTAIVRKTSDIDISIKFHLTPQTLRAHKFNIMLKLNIRRMSTIMLSTVLPYIEG